MIFTESLRLFRLFQMTIAPRYYNFANGISKISVFLAKRVRLSKAREIGGNK